MKHSYTKSDHIFSIVVVSLMLLVIIAIPFLLFYFLLYLVSLTQEINFQYENSFQNFITVMKFSSFLLISTAILDYLYLTFFHKERKRRFINIILEVVLIYAILLLAVNLYIYNSHTIHATNKGISYVASVVLLLYLLSNFIYGISKKIYIRMIEKIKKNY